LPAAKKGWLGINHMWGYGVESLSLTVLDLGYHDAKKVKDKDLTPFLPVK
jgi:hypothetical protein